MTKAARKESDWKLYLRIRDECCEARRNHNIRQDLLEKDIVKRFVKAIRQGRLALAERERCALIAEDAAILGHSVQEPTCREIARKIREG